VASHPPLSDTDPEAARVQLELMRRASPERRLALALSLSQTVIDLARRSLRETHPDATEDELEVLFVRLHHGDELADGLAAHLARIR
jgi:hypothetical protein